MWSFCKDFVKTLSRRSEHSTGANLSVASLPGCDYRPAVMGTMWKQVVGAAGALALGAGIVVLAPASPVAADVSSSASVIINEVYGGGGNTGATHRNDFIELNNTTGAPVDLSTWSLQYKSATGAWAAGGKVNLVGSIPAGGAYLIQGGSDGSVGSGPAGRPGQLLAELQRHHRQRRARQRPGPADV